MCVSASPVHARLHPYMNTLCIISIQTLLHHCVRGGGARMPVCMFSCACACDHRTRCNSGYLPEAI